MPVLILDSAAVELFDAGLYDEALSTIEAATFMGDPATLVVPSLAQLRVLISLAVLPAAHTACPGQRKAGRTSASQRSIAARALTIVRNALLDGPDEEEVLMMVKALLHASAEVKETRKRTKVKQAGFTETPAEFHDEPAEEPPATSDTAESEKDSDLESDLSMFDVSEDEDEVNLNQSQLLFNWSSYAHLSDFLQWMLVYSTVPLPAFQARWRQLEPIARLVIDLLWRDWMFGTAMQSTMWALSTINTAASTILVHWTTVRDWGALKSKFSAYLTASEKAGTMIFPSLDPDSDSEMDVNLDKEVWKGPPDLTQSLNLRMSLLRLVNAVHVTANEHGEARALAQFQGEVGSLLPTLSLSTIQALLLASQPDRDTLVLDLVRRAWQLRFGVPLDPTNGASVKALVEGVPAQGPAMGVSVYSVLAEYCLVTLHILVPWLQSRTDTTSDGSGQQLQASILLSWAEKGRANRASWITAQTVKLSTSRKVKAPTTVDDDARERYYKLEALIYGSVAAYSAADENIGEKGV